MGSLDAGLGSHGRDYSLPLIGAGSVSGSQNGLYSPLLLIIIPIP